MDVATPTADCLNLVYDLLSPVIMKGYSKSSLSHQEVLLSNSSDVTLRLCVLYFSFILDNAMV